jgi:membrane protein YdbS with pleckstrin-like domain
VAAAIPFDLLLIGVENLAFLLFPSRPAAATPGDLSAMGRNALLFVVKGLVLIIPCGIAASLAAVAYFAMGRSVSAAGAVVVAALAVQSLAVVPLVGWAFRRFDPSVDVPA